MTTYFSDALILRFAWGAYGDRISVRNSEMFRLIESAGKSVKKNSTPNIRSAEIKMALTKLKDSIRKRGIRTDMNGSQ